MPYSFTYGTLAIDVFIADIRHTDGKDGLARLGDELCGVRDDTAPMWPFTVPDLLRPDCRVHLKSVTEKILSGVSRWKIAVSLTRKYYLNPHHIIGGQMVPAADELIFDFTTPSLVQHALQALRTVDSVADRKMSR